MSETTAHETRFAFESVDVGAHVRLWVDGNSKITADNGDFEHPKPNAFSLVHVQDCPGSTPACEASCYVQHIEKHRPDIFSRYQHNSTMMRWLLQDPHKTLVTSLFFGHWIQGNVTQFRWHVSGDVFSAEYAKWLRNVVRSSPEVQHWLYTRSFEFVPILTDDTPNLTVNLSADVDNFDAAAECSEAQIPWQRICYLVKDPDDRKLKQLLPGDVIFPDYPLRGREGLFRALTPKQRKMVCPVDTFGKSPAIRCGPCRKCLTT